MLDKISQPMHQPPVVENILSGFHVLRCALQHLCTPDNDLQTVHFITLLNTRQISTMTTPVFAMCHITPQGNTNFHTGTTRGMAL